MADVAKLRMLLGRLKAFRESLPSDWRNFPARYADEYGRIIDALHHAGFETEQLVLPEGAITQREVQKNYLTRERGLLPPAIDRTVLMSAVGGAIAFIEGLLETGEMKPSDVGAPGFGPITISGGNVTFGDGSHINITTVTAGDLLRALQAHVEATVADPATKESVLAQIGSVLKHPASTAVLQVALPELLKRLFGA